MAENKHHIFVELKDKKVRDARMVTLDELRAEGWEKDTKYPLGDMHSAWVRDVATGEKLKNEPCEVWRLKNILGLVGTATYPASKKIEPLFGQAEKVKRRPFERRLRTSCQLSLAATPS